MLGFIRRGIAVSALLLVAGTLPAFAADAEMSSAPAQSTVADAADKDALPAGMTEAQLDGYIEKWVRAHPDVVLEALNKHMADKQRAEQEQQSKAAAKLAPEVLAHADAPYGGNPKGSETIVEFMDYHCGYCKRMDPVLADLVKERPELKIVFVETPILGPQSEAAARAALAVREIDPTKYYDFHRALYAAADLSNDSIAAAAKGIGIDPEAMQAKLKSPEVEKELAWARDMQNRANVRGTPFFIVGNDKVMPGAVDKGALVNALTN